MTEAVGSDYILVVDDIPENLDVLVETLALHGHRTRPVRDGRLALEVARREPPGLVLLDVNMPEMDGYEVCAAFKRDPKLAKIPILFLSANSDSEDKLRGFAAGGLDYITKPFHPGEVIARVETHLRNRRLQVEVDRYSHSLEQTVQEKIKEISESQIAIILALAKLSESRDEDTGNHILRVQQYCRALAQYFANKGTFGNLIDEDFIATLYQASALHDIGKVAIPDKILLKAGPLTNSEFDIMKTHARLGAQTLESILDTYPQNRFIRMGTELARSHHERWDGSGYPEGLVGEVIPLSARILFLADQYDALRNRRPYKEPFDATTTYDILTKGDGRSQPAHFDPRILNAFRELATDFDDVFETLKADSGRSSSFNGPNANLP